MAGPIDQKLRWLRGLRWTANRHAKFMLHEHTEQIFLSMLKLLCRGAAGKPAFHLSEAKAWQSPGNMVCAIPLHEMDDVPMTCFRIDESGYTGFDLLNADQRFQGASAIAIDDREAARLIKEYFPRLQAPEC